MDLSKIPCQEASMLSRETYIPCGRPSAAVIFHQHDGRNVYVMCAACADHNIRHRSGIELVAKKEKDNEHDKQSNTDDDENN